MKVSRSIAGAAGALWAPGGNTVARGPNWNNLLRLVLGHHALAWLDQGVVSATSFVALIMIGRWCEPSQLGAYAVGGSALALLLAAQGSLITRPYTILLHQPSGTPAEHAFSALILSLLLSVGATIVLSATAFGLFVTGANPEVVQIAWALAAITPFVLMREFARRFAFAHFKMQHALLVDTAVAAVSIVGLVWLGWSGRMSAVTALGAMGLACGVGTAGWLFLAHAQFEFRLNQVRATLQRSWQLGKWLLSGQLAIQAQGYMTYWLSLVIAGATVTGIYTACMSIVAFANPLLFGFYNILTPRSVRALKDEGTAGLRRQAVRDSLLLAALMTPFCLLVFAAGEPAMDLLFPADVYRGYGHILNVLTLAALAAAVGVPASNALASAERARAVAVVMAATALLNVVLVWWLMTQFGLLGAAYAVLIAEVAGSLGRWIAYLALVPVAGAPRPRRRRSANAKRARAMAPTKSKNAIRPQMEHQPCG